MKFHTFRLKIMNMKELKLETLRPKTPKSISLSQVGKEERDIKLLRKTAIKNPKIKLSNLEVVSRD